MSQRPARTSNGSLGDFPFLERTENTVRVFVVQFIRKIGLSLDILFEYCRQVVNDERLPYTFHQRLLGNLFHVTAAKPKERRL